MQLKNRQELKAEILEQTLTVVKKLAEGGQGEVYCVTDGEKHYALKWYNIEQSTEEQKEAIRQLVTQGAPQRVTGAGERFIWPLDLIILDNVEQFGYLMPLIDRRHFAELGEVQALRKAPPSLVKLCEISYQIANSYRALHLSGYCYRDISSGNLMFNPHTGDVLICDNDNIGINRQSKAQVYGTMEYMAPEVVRGEADPSTETDLHSLAILLFDLWVWHHPFHGEMEYQIRVWDVPAKRRIYGENPIFIFDPKNKDNQLPNDPDYDTARKRWSYCPAPLQSLFTRAFTDGLHNPAQRIVEGEWQSLFLQLKDGSIVCPKCHAENLWWQGQTTLRCWHCQTEITIPPKLIFADGQHTLLLNKETKLLQRHIKHSSDQPNTIIGEVVQNPQNPNVWGIRNLTEKAWTAIFPDGSHKPVEPQRAAPLKLGLKLNISGTEAEIVA